MTLFLIPGLGCVMLWLRVCWSPAWSQASTIIPTALIPMGVIPVDRFVAISNPEGRLTREMHGNMTTNRGFSLFLERGYRLRPLLSRTRLRDSDDDSRIIDLVRSSTDGSPSYSPYPRNLVCQIQISISLPLLLKLECQASSLQYPPNSIIC